MGKAMLSDVPNSQKNVRFQGVREHRRCPNPCASGHALTRATLHSCNRRKK